MFFLCSIMIYFSSDLIVNEINDLEKHVESMEESKSTIGFE